MTKEKLQKKIVKKFGSMSSFARAAKIERYELQKLFARKEIPLEKMKSIESICDGLKTDNIEMNPIDPLKFQVMKESIDNSGGVYRFCKDNPGFDMRQVYDVYEGKRVRMGGLMQRLFDHFRIE